MACCALFTFATRSDVDYSLLCMFEATRLRRGISNTMDNMEIISNARELVLLHGIKEVMPSSHHDAVEARHCDVIDALNYTFILPDITRYPDNFRTFLHKDLIETTTLVSLEQAGVYIRSNSIPFLKLVCKNTIDYLTVFL